MKKRRLFNPKFWKVWFPFLLLFITIIFGSQGYYSDSTSIWEAAWKSLGHVTGDTSFDIIKTGQAYRLYCVWISRIVGILLIPYAFFLLIHEQYHEVVARFRILRWSGFNIKIGYLFQKKYIVVCGLGWRGCELAGQLLDEGYKVAGIDLDATRDRIHELKQQGMVVIQGDAILADVLKKAHIKNAGEIYVVTDDDEVNCRIAVQINNLIPNNSSNIKRGKFFKLRCYLDNRLNPNRHKMCYVSIEEQKHRVFLNDLFQKKNDTEKQSNQNPAIIRVEKLPHDYLRKNQARNLEKTKTDILLKPDNSSADERIKYRASSSLHIHCFDFTELAVRNLIQKKGIIPVKTQDSPAHIQSVIFGNTSAARALIKYHLQLLHIGPESKRLITVICENVEEEKKLLMQTYPCLRPELAENFAGVTNGLFPDFEFIEMLDLNVKLLTDDFSLYRNISSPSESWRLNVYFCIDEGMQSISLYNSIKDRLNWLNINSGCLSQLYMACYFNYLEASLHSTEDLDVFGSQDDICSPEFIRKQVKDVLAKEVMSIYWPEKQEWDMQTSIVKDDLYDLKWLQAPEWSRESSRQAADHLYLKLAILGLNTDSAVQTPEVKLINIIKSNMSLLSRIEHRRWCAERLLDGWIPLMGDDNQKSWFHDDEFRDNMKNNQHRHVDLIPFELLPVYRLIWKDLQNEVERSKIIDEKEKDEYMIEHIPKLLFRTFNKHTHGIKTDKGNR